MEECNSLVTPQVKEAAFVLSEKGDEAENESPLSRNQQYTLLFLTPNGVHPYESVYRGTKKRLMDEPWRRVKDFYRNAGIEKGADEEHPEDHLAVELGFMAYLSFAGSEMEKEKEILGMLSMQREFLGAHLAKWVPDLCTDIKKIPEVPFYHALADLTIKFIDGDNTYLTALLDT